MITKIEKLKDTGIFNDYKASKQLPEFVRYNLIYGWNGCGKTTLSKVFKNLNLDGQHAFPGIEYKISTTEGKIDQKTKCSSNVLVFNQEYVKENAPGLENPELESKHIFILGETDKKLAEQIVKDKVEKQKISDELEVDDKKAKKISLRTQKSKKETEKQYLFRDVAKVIASSRGRAFRDYDKRDAERIFNQLTEKKLLNDDELEKYLSVAEQKVLDQIDTIEIHNFNSTSLEDHIEKLIENSNNLLAKSIKQNAIQRFKDHQDISEWVEQGMQLHEKHESEKCEYCGNEISGKRLEELAEHFNDAHKEVMEQIELLLDDLRIIYSRINDLTYPDKSNLYEHLRKSYINEVSKFDASKAKVLTELTAIGKELNLKKTKTHTSLDAVRSIDTEIFKDSVTAVNSVIKAHNQISENFDSSITDAKSKLEKHYISEIYDEANLIINGITELEDTISTLQNRFNELSNAITANESLLRNSKLACGKINNLLKTFLGRDDLKFIDSQNGYLILRGNNPAHNLSEGEKTAISFIYFLINLESDNFDLTNGIVIIDDPISSLDIDAVYRVCGLIKSKLSTVHQLFILTHNYEFFYQLKNWFNNDPSIDAKSKIPSDQHGRYFMIRNPLDTVNQRRSAIITELDPLLKNYDSEYHYLFKRLLDFEKDMTVDNNGNIEAVYHYPVIARKVMECFLSFRIPTRDSLYVRVKKMQKLANGSIDDSDVEDVYSFINSHSHLDTKSGLIQFDPTLAKNGQKYIELTLNLIEKTDSQHYRDMVSECKV